MNKRRVLFILHLPPPVHGAAMVGKIIHDSKLINTELDCCYINLSLAASIDDIGKYGLKKLFHFWQLFTHIYNSVRKEKPQLVYITPNAKGNAFYKEWLIVMMLKRMGCKVVAHYHNKGVSIVQHKPIYNWLYNNFFKDLRVILLADCLYHDVRKYVRQKDVFVCPNGIGESNRLVITKKNNSKPTVLFLSNLIISKGVLDLLDACDIIHKKGIVFSCIFVGAESAEMPKEVFQQEACNRSIHEIVSYLGPKYGEEKEDLLCNSDILVLPSHNDCFPLVLLEAMAQSIPCISTTEGAIPEIIDDGKTGYIVEQGNIQQLADKMEILILNEKKRLEMGINGRRKFEEKFTSEKFEVQLCNILQSLLNK